MIREHGTSTVVAARPRRSVKTPLVFHERSAWTRSVVFFSETVQDAFATSVSQRKIVPSFSAPDEGGAVKPPL